MLELKSARSWLSMKSLNKLVVEEAHVELALLSFDRSGKLSLRMTPERATLLAIGCGLLDLATGGNLVKIRADTLSSSYYHAHF